MVKVEDELEMASCPHCFANLYQPAAVCPTCNGPLEQLEDEQNEGASFIPERKRPSLLIVVGMWLLVFPAAFITAYLLMATRGESVLASVGFGFVFLLYAAVLYQVTRNYVLFRPVADEEEAGPVN